MAKNVADVAAESGQKPSSNGLAKAGRRAGKGLRFDRFFTPPGSHAPDLVGWERRPAAIIGEGGKVIFEQKDVEVPRSWSQLAINVVAQKYFRGKQGTSERETSVRQMIDRVVETLARWGREDGYFASDQDAKSVRHCSGFLYARSLSAGESLAGLRERLASLEDAYARRRQAFARRKKLHKAILRGQIVACPDAEPT